MTRELIGLLLTGVVLICTTGNAFAICPDGRDIVRIGVDKYDGTDTRWERNADEVWQPLEDFLNDHLDYRDAPVCIELVPGEMDEQIRSLAYGAPDGAPVLHGAILAPFRYVIASTIMDDLTVIARMRRPEFRSIQDSWDKKSKPPKDTVPRASYHSIVVMRRNAGIWPPDKRRRLRFHFRNTKSTSSFVFPMQYFQSEGWLKNNAIVASSEAGKNDTITKSWDIKQELKFGRSKEQLFEKLLSDHSDFDLLGTNDETVSKYLPDERRLKIAEVFRSEPIPFDALVLRSSLAPLTGSEEMENHIRSAFLATRDLSPADRNKVFPWPPDLSKFSKSYPHRYPDIHDWVEGSSDDYDGVRKAAVLATGGAVVRLAVSERVHSQLKRDRELYFDRVVHNLLDVKNPGERVFLDIQYRKAADLQAMSAELEKGEIDLAELPAYQASELVGRGFPIFGIAQFIGESQDSYKFVIVTNKDGVSADELDKNARYAYTTKQSSSGYHWPYVYLRDELGLGEIAEKNLIRRFDKLGVMQALLVESGDESEIRADYGFMAEFEFNGETGSRGRILTPGQKARLHKVEGADGVVPNAVLVMRKNFSPLFQTYHLRNKPKPPGLAERIEAWRSGMNPTPADQNREAIVTLQKHMFELELIKGIERTLIERGKKSGFLGYEAPLKQTWDDLKTKHEAINPRHIALLLTSLLLVFFSTIGVLGFRYHQENKPRPRAGRRAYSKPASTSTAQPARPSSTEGALTSASRDEIFFSYSHEDREWLERLNKMLIPAKECHDITTWDDSEINAGQQWKNEIVEAMSRARVAVLLVSPDFLASDFIKTEELASLFRAAKREGVRILWISLRSAMYEKTEINDYQALNNPKAPLAELPKNEQDEALKKICEKIVDAF